MNKLRAEKKDTDLEKAIINVIAFFDMFDYPLTDFEVWKFISVKCGLFDAREVLNKITETKSPIGDLVSCKNGFYFLRGRSGIIEIRLKRYVYADRKFKRATRVVKIFRVIPWIKMIAVSNIMGAHNLRDGSDIDLFIITEKRRIWLARFFCVIAAQLLGLRPKKGDTRDKICLNFYVSEEAMNLEELMLRKEGCGDIYFIYWLINLIPIYEVDDAYKKFIQANSWIKSYFPNWQPVEMERSRYVRWYVCGPSGSARSQTPRVRKRLNLLNLLSCSENQFKKLQLNLMPSNLKELMNKDTRVIVNDMVLKLHVNDRRGEYRKNYELRIKNYEL